MKNVLVVKNLSLSVPSARGRVTVVDDVSFDIPAGKKVGLVGESGSGKSLTAYSLMPSLVFTPEVLFRDQ